MTTELRGISSMATRQVLAELGSAYTQRSGQPVAIEAVGGVDAARRVMDGEAFDLIFLATDALAKLEAAGRLRAGSIAGLVRSGVAVAVRNGSAAPDLSSAASVRAAVLAARSLSWSTGPSGVALRQLFERWGILDQIQDRVVQAPPGVPVGLLVARGEVELGFQQLSELIHVAGIDIVGPLPDEIQINTIFAAAIGADCQQVEAAQALIDFMNSAEAVDAKRRQGMTPA
ncbi:MAG: hypothetical protein RJA44_2397 [Pseudomonadota bacterium]